MAAILFLTSDLMFTSRVGAAAKAVGLSLVQVRNPAALLDKITADCQLAIIDLTLEDLNLTAAVKAIRAGATTSRVVAYGPHVDEAALANANDAGCDLVVTRGQFNKQYVELLQAAAQA